MLQSDPLVTSTEVPLLEKSILIVEDETVLANAISKRLKRAGYHPEIAADLAAGRASVKEKTPDLALLDMRLPDGSGLDFLAELQTHGQSFPVLVMSAYGEIEDAVSAMKSGASDYLKKPVDLDELMLTVEKALEQAELSQKLSYSSKRERHAHEEVELLGESQQINAVRQQIERLKRFTGGNNSVPPTVLILGETGSGKDVVARLLHANSARSERPFVHVDCASLPRELIEAELFGHEKGAFTSAHVSRTGLIEAAEDGALFLDEIGELPPDLQAKLLAVLERRTLRKVGATRERPVAAWIIAATHRNITRMVEQGEFRSDLYYRLNVLSLSIAPLRDRSDDILLLARHFAGQSARRYGIKTISLSPETEKLLRAYHWPGNVRELKHMMERAVLLSGEGELEPEVLSLSPQQDSPNPKQGNAEPDAEDAALIRDALAQAGGNVSEAARKLGVSRMTLRYRIKKYNLE